MKVKEFIQAIEDDEFFSLREVDTIEGDYTRVASNLDVSQHRWYSTAMNVYKLEDGFVGVWGLFQIFYEMNVASDFDIVCEAFEVEEVPSVKYKRIYK